ncbi:hypothetical protein [Rariglobus hedericola]|uniref:Cache domain-containing protein n=1 Tax=Rariglobus hedericola TaxID=2597822 RepID=A0A556QPN8_9BACT|nr:hypothetical protein [Rariglobus hedericola]TSJ78605.1 hypothetical protein FPL22_04695 [Rariglobus hedericola]
MKIRILLLSLVLGSGLLHAADIDAATQEKIHAKVAEIKAWASDPALAGAVAAQNASLPADYAAMTQDKWKSLTVLDPFVRSFSKNPAGLFLKSKKADWVAEAFVSDAHGLKVAFLSKPSGWIHAGKPKHDQPMAGHDWQGAVELDDSTGLQQVQISVPVIKDGAAIGALVVGVALSKLE